MKEMVADQTPSTIPNWRRHTDPPGLWTGVIAGSVVLHVLVLWLLRSSAVSSWLSHQPSQAAVLIEIVDGSPAKSTQQKPRIRRKITSPQVAAKSTFNPTITTKKSAANSQAPQAFNPQEQLPPQKSAQQPPAQPNPNQNQFPSKNSGTTSPIPTGGGNTGGQKLPPVDNHQGSSSPGNSTPPAVDEPENTEPLEPPTGDLTPPGSEAGGQYFASVAGVPRQVGRDFKRNPPQVIPSETPLDPLYINQQIEAKTGQPIQFTARLVINDQNALESLKIVDASPAADKSKYENLAWQIFQDWQFQSAYDNDPNQPVYGNLEIKVIINRIGS